MDDKHETLKQLSARLKAEEAEKAKQNEAMRKCLGPDCGIMFKSSHKGNRLCATCAKVVAKRVDINIQNPYAAIKSNKGSN